MNGDSFEIKKNILLKILNSLWNKWDIAIGLRTLIEDIQWRDEEVLNKNFLVSLLQKAKSSANHTLWEAIELFQKADSLDKKQKDFINPYKILKGILWEE
jgi:hypothetical protein